MAENRTIGVLCGGPSAEREISIRSGRAVFEALRGQGIPVSLVVLSEDPEAIPRQIEKANLNAAFVALHGPFGEDGAIQAILERQQIPYTGSGVEGCRYAMDKVHARRRWQAAGLPIPEWRLAYPINIESRARGMRFPLVVKPTRQGSSFGMSIVDSAGELEPAARKAARYGEEILLEEYLAGSEVTVGLLEDRALPVVQVVPRRRFYDTEAKYTPGLTDYLVPAPLADKSTRVCQQLARLASEAVGASGFCRVDMIVVPGRGPVLLELNPIPGMTESSLLPKAAAAAGIGFPELCRRMLNTAFGRSQAAAMGAAAGSLGTGSFGRV